MLTILYEYSGKSFKLVPFTTEQEKDILLLTSLTDPNIDTALTICNAPEELIKELTVDEKTAMLLKYREISVGNEIQLSFTCKMCGSGNENSLDCSEIVGSSNITNPKIKDAFKEFKSDELQDFVNVDIDELDIDEYELLIDTVKDQVTKFNFIKPLTCQKCGKDNHVRINELSFLIENLSDDSLMSMYQTYNDLSFFGTYSKLDIDSMYPFERTILVSLLNKTREEMNK